MAPKTQQRAMELCVLIESELGSMSVGSDTRPPELAKVVGYLDELRTLIEARDPPPANKQVSHLGSAVWRVVLQVSLELIKALANSQKYTRQPSRGKVANRTWKTSRLVRHSGDFVGRVGSLKRNSLACSKSTQATSHILRVTGANLPYAFFAS